MNPNSVFDDKWYKKGTEEPNDFAVLTLEILNEKGFFKPHILDVGAGGGRDSLFFLKQGCSVTAIDIAKSSIEILKEIEKKHKLLSVVNCDIRDYFRNVKDNAEKFDCIYAFSSLHYFNDEETISIYKELSKKLQNKGLFAIALRTQNDPKYEDSKSNSKTMYYNGIYRNYYKKSDILNFFDISGLKKVYLDEKIIQYHSKSVEYKAPFWYAIGEKIL